MIVQFNKNKFYFIILMNEQLSFFVEYSATIQQQQHSDNFQF